MVAFALRMMAFVLQDDGARDKMMSSGAGVEALGKKAMPSLPEQRETAIFFHRLELMEIIFPRLGRSSHTQKLHLPHAFAGTTLICGAAP